MERDAALLTDVYELFMLQAYWAEELTAEAAFSLFVRRLPQGRNYLLACGLDTVLDSLEQLHVSSETIEFLKQRKEFSRDFLDWLVAFRFRGDVWAVPEGTPLFANEPIVEVVAPMPEAQLPESFLINQIHLQTVLASKASRVVQAAHGRPVIDFGMRRMHGTDAALKGARAFRIAGVSATSNVLAGRVYRMPLAGTMAHSYVQAHESELDSFRSFSRRFPGAVLLVDTYDSLEGVRHVVELARELGEEFRVRAIRLDSGDLAQLAFEARRILDRAGLEQVEILASGGLDEWAIAELVERGAPIAGFGVGTRMGVSEDAPCLDIAYKLVEYAGRGRFKRSPGKEILPGRKQVFRIEEKGRAVRDVLAEAGERHPGRPLLQKVMEQGRGLPAGSVSIEAARGRAAEELRRLPDSIRALKAAEPPYPVQLSQALSRRAQRLGSPRSLAAARQEKRD